MTENQQKDDGIKDIRKLEFYRIIGEGYKAVQDGRTSTIEDVREKLRQQRMHRDMSYNKNQQAIDDLKNVIR